MEIRNTAILHEKVGENDHNYYVAPGASLEEVEFVLNRYLTYVLDRKAAAKVQPIPSVAPAPVEEPKVEEPKAE